MAETRNPVRYHMLQNSTKTYNFQKPRRHWRTEENHLRYRSADKPQTSNPMMWEVSLLADTADTLKPNADLPFCLVRRHLPQTSTSSYAVRRHPQTLADIRRQVHSIELDQPPINYVPGSRLRRASRRSHDAVRHHATSRRRFSLVEKCHAKMFSHLLASNKSGQRYLLFHTVLSGHSVASS